MIFEKFSISGVNALPRFGMYNTSDINPLELRPFSKSISLYIHIPFCKSICHFCMLRRGAKAVDDVPKSYLDYLIKELNFYKLPFEDTKIHSIYFGGGTPSMLSPIQFELIINNIYSNFKVSEEVEITFEGEPQSLNNPLLLRSLCSNGVNRISFGLQTFDPHLRNLLGRTDTIAQIDSLFANLTAYPFKEINIDYLYNLPNTNIDFLEREFRLIKSLPLTSVDCHPLKYISCSSFMLRNIVESKLTIPNSNLRISMFNFIREFMLDNGFKEQFVDQYSIYDKTETNKYMRSLYGLDGGEYLGIGPGARSHYADTGFTNAQKLENYFSKIDNGILPIERITEASLTDNYITCFPKRNDQLNRKNISKSLHSEYFLRQLEGLRDGNYIDVTDGCYFLTSLGISWYQNIQEVLLSPVQRAKHLENALNRSKKFEKYGSYFENIGTTLC